MWDTRSYGWEDIHNDMGVKLNPPPPIGGSNTILTVHTHYPGTSVFYKMTHFL